MSDQIGQYRIVGKLGEGGMGLVYVAHDERLDRPVALKVIRPGRVDEQARKRFWREARAAAAVSHPAVCPVHEVGEDAGTLYIAMQLLEGESLAQRLERGALPAAEATRIALDVLGALEDVHGRDLVHRDLKPSNLFLTPHGVQILDFGVATLLPSPTGELDETASHLTQEGTLVGTPRYMSPELVKGDPVDARSDLFAVAAILYEMLSGRPAFQGGTMVEVLHATLYEEPPALGGSPTAAALDRVVRRGLAKRPEQRPPTASDMAREIREAFLADDTGTAARVVAMTRLIVLPFRLLRPDPDVDFLAFSLPEAITASLCGLDTVVVRSSLTAARYAGDVPDLKRLAAEADVDVVLTGTLLRAGAQLRVSAQLVEAPGGTVVWSHASQMALQEVFELQDALVRRILEALSPQLTVREHRLLRHDVPRTPAAYEFYLRANQLIQDVGLNKSGSFALARDLYLRCLELDGDYAPAWARLGRCYRLLGKAGDEPEANLAKAESSLRRALELNPQLAPAHNVYAQIETERGRPADGVTRLVKLARPECADPEVFAGLVHACRYSGLLEASIEAHLRARRLDRKIPTSVRHTYWLAGDYERAHEEAMVPPAYFDSLVLTSMGHEGEALSILRAREAEGHPEAIQHLLASLRALLEGRPEESLEASEWVLVHFNDSEARYFMARQLARLGAHQRALEEMSRVVDLGFHCPQAFARDPWLEPLRGTPEFAGVLERAESGRQRAAHAFVNAGGERLLGLRPS